jgi:hypothetical protein
MSILFGLRVNLNVAIVAMVNQTAINSTANIEEYTNTTAVIILK